MNNLLIETILCVKTEGQAALHRAGPPGGKDSVKGMAEGLRLTIGKRSDSAISAIKKEESINKNDVIQEFFGFFLPIFTDFRSRSKIRRQCGGLFSVIFTPIPWFNFTHFRSRPQLNRLRRFTSVKI